MCRPQLRLQDFHSLFCFLELLSYEPKGTPDTSGSGPGKAHLLPSFGRASHLPRANIGYYVIGHPLTCQSHHDANCALPYRGSSSSLAIYTIKAHSYGLRWYILVRRHRTPMGAVTATRHTLCCGMSLLVRIRMNQTAARKSLGLSDA